VWSVVGHVVGQETIDASASISAIDAESRELVDYREGLMQKPSQHAAGFVFGDKAYGFSCNQVALYLRAR